VAAEAHPPARETVTVTGRGSARAAPDMLTVDLAVEAHASGVAAAWEAAGTAMSAVQAAVAAAGVDHSDIFTAGVTLRAEYDHQRQQVAGYVAAQSLRVLVRDLTVAPRVAAVAIDAGGDAARVGGLTFGITDSEQLQRQAREAAVADARAAAGTYASATERSLGRVVRIVEGAGGGEPRPLAARTMAAAEPAGEMPLQAGTHAVSAVVTVEWELR
jgi:uncharacterized protein YggE